mmetsp:Transcript_27233/g.33077  ORF Transcript_27233/g.33077 Transcript_27233/m.33077 type:complete len:86 (-) Transcript_27233:296-553(-)
MGTNIDTNTNMYRDLNLNININININISLLDLGSAFTISCQKREESECNDALNVFIYSSLSALLFTSVLVLDPTQTFALGRTSVS